MGWKRSLFLNVGGQDAGLQIYKMAREEVGSLILMTSAGWSMTPFVKPGDRLVVEPVAVDRLRIGDLVTYRSVIGDTMVCHRCVRKARSNTGVRLYLRGDAGTGSGEWVEADRVRGRVVAIQRGRRIVTLTDPLHRLAQYGVARCHLLLRAARRLKRGVYRLIAEGRDTEAVVQGGNRVNQIEH